MSFETFEVAHRPEVVNMKSSLAITNDHVVIVLEVAYCEQPVFIDISDFLAKALNNILAGDVERSFPFWHEVHDEILIIFVI